MSRIRSLSAPRACAPLARPFARLLTLAALGPAAAASAQVSFSIDWQSPPVGLPDTCFGMPITEGDILVPPFFGPPMPGPLPLPCIAISGGFGPPALGLALFPHPAAVGHPPGVPGFVELDALSYGADDVPIMAGAPGAAYDWYFSVDEFATGIPGTPAPPAVWTEGPLGAAQASADVFVDAGMGFFVPCGIGIVGNSAVIDGDGVAPSGSPGIGLFEPNPPTPGMPMDPGSNLDALDVDTFIGPGMPITVYFSLDSGFIDPIEGFPNSGSALVNGFVGGDVLLSPAPGAPPFAWAPAFMLGLDLFGMDTDDLDALVLYENGTGVFEPPVAPFSWVGGGTDAIFFSVRRGSALVTFGIPDSRCGLPIEPGDILMPPIGGAFVPAIWIPAETLGLATVRSGTAIIPYGDDLDALDVVCDLEGDWDGDADVDLGDLVLLLGVFGVGSDLGDLAILLSQFGTAC